MATSLQRRPQAVAISVEDLMEKVARGAVRVPNFQRGLRWRSADFRLLFDSLHRGYPVGSLLFWKREAPAGLVRLGPLRIEAPSAADAWWVVDGQQRITALAGALLSAASRDDHKLFFDLERDAVVASLKRDPDETWLPLERVLDSTQLLDWLAKYPRRESSPDHVKTALRFGKAIREYQLPGYVVEASEEAEAREIFTRLNTAGRPLKRDEVFDALSGSVGGDEPTSLSALAAALDDLDFGTVEPGLVLKTVLSLGGLDVTRDIKLSHAKVAPLLKNALAGLREAIVFVKGDARIPRIELMPYTLPLAILGKFFALHPDANARSRTLLSRWIWRGAVSGLHRGESVPDVREQFNDVGPNEEESVQRLLRWTRPERLTTWRFGEFQLKTARSKLEANLLIAFGPRTLTGDRLDVTSIIAEHGGQAFQRVVGFPSLKGQPERQLVTKFAFNSLADRVFLWPKQRSLLAALKSTTDAVLQSHLIERQELPPTPPSAASGEVDFLAKRRERLQWHLLTFLEQRTGWAESDRPSIAALKVADETAP